MSSSTLQKKVIEFLKKKESINAKTKEKNENENLVSEINEYDEVKENISEDIRNLIREYHQQLDFIPEANIYKIFKKFDFNKIVMDSHVEVILQRSKNIDTADWINVAKKPKKFVKPKIEKKEILKKFETENYEGDNEENYQSKKYTEDKYNRYNYPRNYRKRSFNNEFKEDYYYSKRTEYNQKRDYEEDYIKPKNYESDYPKKRPNYESNYLKKKINYANYEIEYVPKDSNPKVREKSAEQTRERYTHNRNTDVPILPKKPHYYERYDERNEHQNPRVFESNKKYLKKKKIITEITYVPKEASTDLVAEQEQPIEKHEKVPEVRRNEADEPKIKEQPLSVLKPDPNSDTSTLLQKDKEDPYAEEKPKKENHRSYPSPKPDVSKKLENTFPNKVEEDGKSVPVTNQGSSFLNGNSYQANPQASFDATMQSNYFPQVPANFNLQQPPINFQQPLANNLNNNSAQNNASAANCPMLCLMMPNGMQIPFPIMMPNQNTNPAQPVNPQDYYFQFLSQIGTMMSGMTGNYNMFGSLPNAQTNSSQPEHQPQFIQKAAEPAKHFSMNSNVMFQAPNIFNQTDYYLYNPSNFDSYFHKN